MSNLITPKQKNIVKTDYYLRLIALAIFLLALLGGFFLAYVIPYYIAVGKKDLLVAEKFQSVISAENKENTGESVSSLTDRVLDELKTTDLYFNDKLIPSIYFNKVVENKNSNIKINKISWNLSDDKNMLILVGGISKNREGLVSFIDDLKIKGGFENIEMPVSEFAKDSNIPFSLNINIAL